VSKKLVSCPSQEFVPYIHLLEPLRLGRARSGVEKLVDNLAGRVANTLHNLAVINLSNDLLDEFVNVTVLS
jgi:hypothetical protein